MIKARLARIAPASFVVLVVASGAVGVLRYGGICSLDIWILSATDQLGFALRALGTWRLPITLTCPLGFLERSLANPHRGFVLHSCTKCLECSTRCPTKGIKFRLWA